MLISDHASLILLIAPSLWDYSQSIRRARIIAEVITIKVS